ncbi:hypothetical protein APSETT444_001163 [Aspergillus pseudonomiae]
MGSALQVDVYVAAAIPAKTGSQDPSKTWWSPISCTLIQGPKSAILVDTPITRNQAEELAYWIKKTAPGKKLEYIYTTHAHGDHFFGNPVILKHFPGATCIATKSVARGVKQTLDAAMPRWEGWFPDGQIPTEGHVVPDMLPETGAFDLDGYRFSGIDVAHSDTHASSFLHVPDLRLVVAGDIVYGESHQFLAEATTTEKRRDWLHALDHISSLKPSIVIPGHKRASQVDGPYLLDLTREYILAFEEELERLGDARKLEEAMKNRKRGRPRKTEVRPTHEDREERRRLQIRQAQRAYRSRKEEALSKYEARIAQLEGVLRKMSTAALSFSEHVAHTGALTSNSDLQSHLRATIETCRSCTAVLDEADDEGTTSRNCTPSADQSPFILTDKTPGEQPPLATFQTRAPPSLSVSLDLVGSLKGFPMPLSPGSPLLFDTATVRVVDVTVFTQQLRLACTYHAYYSLRDTSFKLADLQRKFRFLLSMLTRERLTSYFETAVQAPVHPSQLTEWQDIPFFSAGWCAANVLFMNYAFDNVILAPIRAARNRHWIVVCVSLMSLLMRILVPSLLSGLFVLTAVTLVETKTLDTWALFG